MVILGYTAGFASHGPFCDNLSHDHKPTTIRVYNKHTQRKDMFLII